MTRYKVVAAIRIENEILHNTACCRCPAWLFLPYWSSSKVMNTLVQSVLAMTQGPGKLTVGFNDDYEALRLKQEILARPLSILEVQEFLDNETIRALETDGLVLRTDEWVIAISPSEVIEKFPWLDM